MELRRMRKSLLIISFICSTLFIVSCHNEGTCEIHKQKQGKIVFPDSIKRDVKEAESKNIIPVNSKTESKSLKDTTNDRKNHAIIHYGPDQTKIDSIKNAKLKKKK